MQSVLSIKCFICKMSSLSSSLYAQCPDHVVLLCKVSWLCSASYVKRPGYVALYVQSGVCTVCCAASHGGCGGAAARLWRIAGSFSASCCLGRGVHSRRRWTVLLPSWHRHRRAPPTSTRISARLKRVQISQNTWQVRIAQYLDVAFIYTLHRFNCQTSHVKPCIYTRKHKIVTLYCGFYSACNFHGTRGVSVCCRVWITMTA